MSLVKEIILFYPLSNLLKHFIILDVSFTHRREGSHGGFSLTGNSVAFSAAEARPWSDFLPRGLTQCLCAPSWHSDFTWRGSLSLLAARAQKEKNGSSSRLAGGCVISHELQPTNSMEFFLRRKSTKRKTRNMKLKVLYPKL